jgi:hypothetical protein
MTFDPSKTYLALRSSGEARPIAVDAAFWEDVAAGKYPVLDDGWLVGAYPMDADWTTWEMHPEGEEVLTLLSGELELIVDEGGQLSTVVMVPGRTFVMPRGAWHRGIVKKPAVMLGLTWGKGTQHRPIDPPGDAPTDQSSS